jgi:hypothetical protein
MNDNSNNLKELIKDYSNSITTAALIRAQAAPYTEDFSQAVLLYKLVKHRRDVNLRSMAKYLALWIHEDLGPLCDRAKELAREAELKYDKTHGVGYPHADGTYHWFSV